MLSHTHGVLRAFQAKIKAGHFKRGANTSLLVFIIGWSKLHFNAAQLQSVKFAGLQQLLHVSHDTTHMSSFCSSSPTDCRFILSLRVMPYWRGVIPAACVPRVLAGRERRRE